MTSTLLASQSQKAALSHQIEGLPDLSYPELVAHWTKYIGRPPPNSASRALLERAIAYSLQERQFGGLSKSILKVLLKHTQASDGARFGRISSNTAPGEKRKSGTIAVIAANAQPMKSTQLLRPGTRLVREWQGKNHSVEVRDEGFLWNGKVFGSLSAVATAITGVRWSGPRFFGL